jgi:mono/diheme cytochrome c family protein
MEENNMKHSTWIFLCTVIALVLVFGAACGSPEAAPPDVQDAGDAVVPAEEAVPQEEEPAEVVEPDQEAEELEEEIVEEEGEAGLDPEILNQGRALLNGRCIDCHSTETATNKTKTLAEWESTIDRMIQKGAQVSPEERDILAVYLAETAGN